MRASPDGKTIVALLDDSRLLVIKNVDRLAKDEMTLDLCAVMVHLTCPTHAANSALYEISMHLAFEYGRVGVTTVRIIILFPVFSLKYIFQMLDVFAITLDTLEHHIDSPWLEACRIPSDNSPMPPGCPFPNMVICRILPFKREYLRQVTCLQMTRSRMFITYHPSIATGEQQQPALEIPNHATVPQDPDDPMQDDHEHADAQDEDLLMFDNATEFEGEELGIQDPVGHDHFPFGDFLNAVSHFSVSNGTYSLLPSHRY